MGRNQPSFSTKRVPACSSDCLVLFNSGEGTRQECAPTERQRYRLGFLDENDSLGQSAAWLEYGRPFQHASQSADLNQCKQQLFSSGCDRVTGARLASSTNFICLAFDLMAAVHVKIETNLRPSGLLHFESLLSESKTQARTRLRHLLIATYEGYCCTVLLMQTLTWRILKNCDT